MINIESTNGENGEYYEPCTAPPPSSPGNRYASEVGGIRSRLEVRFDLGGLSVNYTVAMGLPLEVTQGQRAVQQALADMCTMIEDRAAYFYRQLPEEVLHD